MRILFTLSLALVALSLFAQVSKNTDLFTSLQKQDSAFFERGFNQCDLEYLKAHIAEDLKFYHDQSGFQNKQVFFENTRQYICGNSPQKPIRKVDPNSLEVFPLYNNGALYGAIQKGVHHFYLREAGKEDVWTSTASFTHVWLVSDSLWQLSEVLSYDHHDPAPSNANREIEVLLKENNVPALGLGILEDGKLTKVEVYGTVDKQKTAPYNTLFKVASLTKPVVALLTLKLIDKGLLDMNEPLYTYWIDPDIKKDKRYKLLTPKIVLSHQTGFPNWRYLEKSQKLSFQFEPGTKFQYSGEGFEFLRKALESKFNQPIEVLAKEHVFEPLNMHDTHFWWEPGVEESRYAQNFNDTGGLIYSKKYYEANAASNLLTTVEDYGRFMQHLINGGGLSDSLYQQMLAHQVAIGPDDFFGLGWEILTNFSSGEYALIHTGKDPGVSTLAVWFPQCKNGYLVFLNGDGVDPIYEYLLTKRLYMGQELWNKR